MFSLSPIPIFIFFIGFILFAISMYELHLVYHNNPYKIKYNEHMFDGFIFCIIKCVLNGMHGFFYLFIANGFKKYFNDVFKKIHIFYSDNKFKYLMEIFYLITNVTGLMYPSINIILYITNIYGFFLFVSDYNTGIFKNIIQTEIIIFICINIINYHFLNYLYILNINNAKYSSC